jgi:hypothetical protein
MTGGKPIAVLLQSISYVSAINPLVAFYDIHGGKREVLIFYFVTDTTRDSKSLRVVLFPLKAFTKCHQLTLKRAESGTSDNLFHGHFRRDI